MMMALEYKQLDHIGFHFVAQEMAPCSAYGRQALKKLRPYAPHEKEALRQELDNLEKTLAAAEAQPQAVNRLERTFRQVKDIRASLRHCESGVLEDVELFEIKRYLLQLEEILPRFAELDEAARYEGLAFEVCTPALELLDPEKTRVASFHISARYSAELTSIRKEKQALEQDIRVANTEEKERLMLRRQSIVAREQAEEERIRTDLSAQLRPWVAPLLHNAEAIARLDMLLQKAALAKRWGGVKPRFGTTSLAFTAMVNPQISTTLEAQGKSFTPVTLSLEKGATVITGANMGGKSVVLKTLALNTLLAHCGFYPFATEAALPHLDAIHLVSEDLEATDRGLSSFGGEIAHFTQLAGRLEGKAPLLLLDEFARGTNPEEGAAIAWAVTGWLQEKDAFSVLTTHFDHVASAAGAHWQVAGLKGADLDALRRELATGKGENGLSAIARHMNYGLFRVEKEEEMPRDALTICRLLGLPDKIVENAETKLLTFTGEDVK